MFLIILLALASASHAAAVGPAKASLLATRADVNATLSNATAIVQNLDYTSNCSLSISWYENLPSNGAGSGSDTLNVEFLRSALPTVYQDESDDQITSFYDDMSSGALASLGWLRTAKDDIETSCITPQFEKQLSISNLDPTQNCTATAIFLSSLGWIAGAQNYTASSSNDTSWMEFLRAALPVNDQNNLTDLELIVYRNYFLASENAPAITGFLKNAFDACAKDICEIQGYTGNPDIGGIGVIISYSIEAALVTLYFVAINFEIWMERVRQKGVIHPRLKRALTKASDELADGALFFSFSISAAGWVSFVSGTSYYEKLVFTSANVLALSALFAFLGMFTAEGHKKRGEYILAVMIAAILTESAIQYIFYMSEPNDKYDDFPCLHPQFQDQGYHPAIFEALFFLLLGLSVIAAVVGILWLLYNHKHPSSKAEINAWVTKIPIHSWVIGTRIFIQTVAIAVMWVELVYLWKIRHIMARIAGSTWSEGDWGFGQILALFIWLPPIIDILGWLFLPEWMLGGSTEKTKLKCKCGLECTSEVRDHVCNPACVFESKEKIPDGTASPAPVPVDPKDKKNTMPMVKPVSN